MNLSKHRYLYVAIFCASILTLCAWSSMTSKASVIGAREADRTEARQAVSEFVKKSLQGWNIKGMSSQLYPGYVFLIDAVRKARQSYGCHLRRSQIPFRIRRCVLARNSRQ